MSKGIPLLPLPAGLPKQGQVARAIGWGTLSSEGTKQAATLQEASWAWRGVPAATGLPSLGLQLDC